MTKIKISNTLYKVQPLSKFQKQIKEIGKQGKDLEKLKKIVISIANGEKSPEKYKDHNLIDNKYFKNCRECHIEPD